LVKYEGGFMTKEIEALETLDEYSDDEYAAYLEYTALKDQCIIDPTTLYIDKDHEFISEYIYFAQTDGLDIKVGDWETRIC
jgi:hypothetical protein